MERRFKLRLLQIILNCFVLVNMTNEYHLLTERDEKARELFLLVLYNQQNFNCYLISQ
jgi:hypothetical protein